jgi:aminobenzoyl-glutamate utilization protein B
MKPALTIPTAFTARAGMSILRNGMVVAARALTFPAMDPFTDGTRIDAARASFEKRKGSQRYASRLPPDQKPPLDSRNFAK